MYRRILGAALLMTAFLALPAMEVSAQKKDAKAPGGTIDSAGLNPGEYAGILKATPGSDRLFTIEVEQQKLVPTGGGARPGGGVNPQRVLQLQQQMAQAQRQLQTARTPQQRLQAQRRLTQLQQQIQQAQLQAARGAGAGGGAKVETTKVTVQFQAHEKVKVRTMVLPEAFDDKGNPKTYTAKEKAELRGMDKTAPGYESSAEKLQVGQIVRVKLANVAKKGAKGDDDGMSDKPRQATMIVILQEADPNAAGGRAPKKKK